MVRRSGALVVVAAALLGLLGQAPPARSAVSVDCPSFTRAAAALDVPPADPGAPRLNAPDGVDLTAPQTPYSDQVSSALRKANNYTLQVWLPRCYGNQVGTALDPRGEAERAIRPPAMAAYALATAAQTDVYDAPGRADALAAAKRLVLGLVLSHVANKSGGWGHHWQSSLWTYYAGTAAWLIAGDLSPDEQAAAARMIIDEAEYRQAEYADDRIGFMYSATGKLLRPGDSQAEENAWNSQTLSLAALALPNHPRATEWRRLAGRYQLSSYLLKADLATTTLVDGARIGRVARGFNLQANGTMINHSRVHPEYMSLITMKTSELLTAGLSGQAASQSSGYRLSRLYRVFLSREISGKTIYRPGSYAIYYPQGNDWGVGRISNYALLDAYAARFAVGTAKTAAGGFYQRHLDRQTALMRRFSDGRTYAGTWSGSGSEYRYVGREQITAADLAQMWLVEYLTGHERLRFSSTGLLG